MLFYLCVVQYVTLTLFLFICNDFYCSSWFARYLNRNSHPKKWWRMTNVKPHEPCEPLWYFQALLTTTVSMSLLVDILDFNDTEQQCLISKCRTKNCKTCNILITDVHNTSNLTNKSYVTRSYDDLNCKSANVVYWLECNLCGLVHVGETKDKLHKRIFGHRSINAIFYQHFNQPDHSVLSMRVRIIEQICHRTNNPNLATPLRRQKEDYWKRELGTATSYGCNDKIDGISIPSSPICRPMNVLDICSSSPLRKWSHGHRHYIFPIFHDFSLNDLLAIMHASHSLETIFTTPFKPTCLVQLMSDNRCYTSEFTWIKTYSNRLEYCRSQAFQTCWY